MNLKTYLFMLSFVFGVSFRSDGGQCRLIVSSGDLYGLCNGEMHESLHDARGLSRVNGFNLLSVDCSSKSGCPDGFLAVQVLDEGKIKLLVFQSERTDPVYEILGEAAGIHFDSRTVGYIALSRETIEDAFFIEDLDKKNKRMIVSGGFFECYPVVSSGDYLYVYRSGKNSTLKVDSNLGTYTDPGFLKGRVVLAVWDDNQRYLVWDRKTNDRMVLSAEGQVVSVLDLNRGDEAIEFSVDGDFVYTSVARREDGIEVRDLALHEVATGKLVRVVRSNMAVGLGQISRNACCFQVE